MTAFFKMIALTAFCILSVPAAAEVIRFDVENHSQRRAWVDLPDNAKGAVPVVVLLHSFTGLDQRETVIGRAIHNAGYATAAPDLRCGIYSSEADRPSGRDFAAMTIRLIAVLRSDARFDSNKVALVGFSQGADIGLNLAGFHLAVQVGQLHVERRRRRRSRGLLLRQHLPIDPEFGGLLIELGGKVHMPFFEFFR